jgi:hypothetical protein
MENSCVSDEAKILPGKDAAKRRARALCLRGALGGCPILGKRLPEKILRNYIPVLGRLLAFRAVGTR